MMNRRQFTGALAGMAAAGRLGAADGGAARFYLLNAFELRHRDQAARANAWLEKTWLPEISRTHPGPKMVLDAVIATHSPRLLAVLGVATLEESQAAQAALRASLAGDALLDSLSISLLEGAPDSPPIATQNHPTPRYFELRTYRSPVEPQLAVLHRRFAGSGIFPLFCATRPPHITYLIPFDSLAAREQAWDAFNADPEWIEARKQFGRMARVSDISIYRAAAYSPLS